LAVNSSSVGHKTTAYLIVEEIIDHVVTLSIEAKLTDICLEHFADMFAHFKAGALRLAGLFQREPVGNLITDPTITWTEREPVPSSPDHWVKGRVQVADTGLIKFKHSRKSSQKSTKLRFKNTTQSHRQDDPISRTTAYNVWMRGGRLHPLHQETDNSRTQSRLVKARESTSVSDEPTWVTIVQSTAS
jgi:hypothetical protein